MTDFWIFTKRTLAGKGTLAWAMFFAFISAAMMGGGLLALGPILKLIIDPVGGKSLVVLAEEYNAKSPTIPVPAMIIAYLPDDRFQGVVLVIVTVAVMAIIGAASNFMHQSLSITVSARTIARARLEAFSRVVHMPLGTVILRGPSQLVARIIRDTAELQRGLIAMTSKAIVQVSRGVSAMCVALFVSWKLTAVAVIALPLMWIILRKLGKKIRRGMRGALQGQEHLLRIATESLQGLRAVKAGTAELQATARFAQVNEEVVEQELRARTARAMASPIIETMAILGVGALAIFVSNRILQKQVPFERFLLAITSLAVAGASFRPLVGLVNDMQAASAPAKRVLEILDEPREDADDSKRKDLLRHRLAIAFDHVSLTYPGATRPAVDDVTLRVAHGQRVAIVGPNGSGKTTLVSLLPRLLSPDVGRVLIDDQDVAGVSLRSLRQQIGVVTQETILFRGTIAQNISYGATGASERQVIDAAVRAHAHEFIQRIPGAYEADILEQGASLSGGQRQRLSIARAILRDPAILILDEATSQLDAESEAHISAALEEFCRGRTALIIAHRLASVVNADRIIVMDAGRIVDQGTHDELLGRCKLYQALTRTQLVGAA